MRLQSEIQVTVRKTVIGGPDPLICLPLVAAEKHDLLDQAAALKQLKPDMVEWRIDGYRGIEDTTDCLAALNALRLAIGEIVDGKSMTHAAHAAGFADQAHFAREFRRTFGAPATPSLAKVRRARARYA